MTTKQPWPNYPEPMYTKYAIRYLLGVSDLIKKGKIPADWRPFAEAVEVMNNLTAGVIALSETLDRRDYPRGVFDFSGWKQYREINRILKSILDSSEMRDRDGGKHDD